MSGTPRGGLIRYFAENLVAANLIMFVLMAGGLLSVLNLTAQVFPTIDAGQISVSVAYPGATPSEVEESITRRVEEAVLGIEGVDRVTSRASENLGSITISLKDFVNATEVRNDIESAIDQLSAFPPEEAEQPNIVAAQTTSDVITIVVSSEIPELELRKRTEALEASLLALPSITMTQLLGARDYEISIEVSESALRQFDLAMSDIASAIRQSSVNLSSGELKTSAGDLLLRTNKKRLKGAEFEDIVVRANADGSVLRLGQIADIRDGFVDVDLINQFNGRNALLVKVRKSEAEDALAIGTDVKKFIAEYDGGADVDIAIWDDQVSVLEERVSLLVRNAVLGFALVFLFLVIMLDLRLALWVAMGVPISFLGAFLFFDPFGVNINMMSLFALLIVLGIVVDDAVVVGENIISEQEKHDSAIDGAIAGVKGVIGPVTVGVLTTMAAFAPLLFVTGTFGQIMGVVPIVVIAVLAISLIEVFYILPAHLSHGGAWSRWPLDRIQAKVGASVERFRDNRLTPAIRFAVRHRYMTIAGGVLLLILAGALMATGAVRFIFFPALESNVIRATVEFPVGTPFSSTRSATERMVTAAETVNQKVGGTSFESVSVTIGGRSRTGGGPGGSGSMTVASHLSSIQIQLNSEPLRSLSANELEKMWRDEVGEVPGLERLSFVSSFFSGGANVEFELSHADEKTLLDAVEWLKNAYRETPAMYQVQDSDSAGKRQYDIELTPAGIAAGLSPEDVARQIRSRVFGQEVQRIQRGRNELKVMVRYPESERNSTTDFFNARIRLSDGSEMSLSTVAGVAETRSLAAINRIDGRRIVSVSGKVDTLITTPGEVTSGLKRAVLPELKAAFPGLTIAEAGFGREQSEDLSSLGRMTLIAIMIIFALIASQLRSYGQPLIILAGIPFGAAGAVVGHYLLGFDLSFISIFGMVALSGVVVNDSLVLIDRYNKVRDSGIAPGEAIVQAANRRFRAIFLTTATTALGLTPMLFETSTQAQFLVPMAVSLATGIVFASVIILFVMPSLVMVREDLRRTEQPQAIPVQG